MTKYLILLATCLALSACGKDPVSVSPTDNKSVQVEEMFTHDGVRVYRFYDAGRTVYFTSKGDAQVSRTEYCGKGCYRTETTQTLNGAYE